MSSSTIWFITGVSSGFGLDLALHVLLAGHTVYGTVRNREKSSSAVSQIETAGGKCVVLDVTVLESIPTVIQGVLEGVGRIDVLVNNAGWAVMGALEDMNIEQARLQMDTNFFGPVQVIQAVLPSMRERKSSSIVNMSSVAGINPFPGGSLYSTSKHALEGLSDCLSAELAPFNISVLIVEPTFFKTNILGSSNIVPVSEPYQGTPAASMMEVMKKFQVDGTEPGDTAKAAKIIFDSVAGDPASRLIGQVRRLPLGSRASTMLGKKIELFKSDYERTKELAKKADRDDL